MVLEQGIVRINLLHIHFTSVSEALPIGQSWVHSCHRDHDSVYLDESVLVAGNYAARGGNIKVDPMILVSKPGSRRRGDMIQNVASSKHY